MLKYPNDLNETVSDSITFSHTPYRPNKGSFFGSGGQASVPAEVSEMIRLYVPNSTPATSQSNSWGRADFAGELGQLRSTTIDAAPAIVKQIGTRFAANTLGVSPNQALAVSRGQVYNPNVELLYDSPQLRGFSFEFNFVPKNRSEASTIDDIIYAFKRWSSPKDPGGTEGVFCVPHIWNVVYSGLAAKKMAKFKPAALTDVTIQENAGSNTHSTFDDGTPVVTTLVLTFKEVNIITRNDHESARGEGFRRGY